MALGQQLSKFLASSAGPVVIPPFQLPALRHAEPFPKITAPRPICAGVQGSMGRVCGLRQAMPRTRVNVSGAAAKRVAGGASRRGPWQVQTTK
jgi:hypothetical protein